MRGYTKITVGLLLGVLVLCALGTWAGYARTSATTAASISVGWNVFGIGCMLVIAFIALCYAATSAEFIDPPSTLMGAGLFFACAMLGAGIFLGEILARVAA